jgi:hypothetical protein
VNDRELLEAAAKAAGYKVRTVSGYEEGGTVSFYMEPGQLWWNPLQDDGDALRLAVKLRLTVHHFLQTEEVEVCLPYCDNGVNVFWREDPYAATRRAIVRAAAALGGAK